MSKSVVFTKNWIIPRKLTLIEREILFLTAEAAGMEIDEDARAYKDISFYPFIGKSNNLSGCSGNLLKDRYFTHFTYEYVLKMLRKEIEDLVKKQNQKYDKFIKISESF